jgi:hypothetical protein
MQDYKIKHIEINPILGYNKNLEMIDLIENGSLDDFLQFAKEYNIFQNSTNKFYLSMCEKIKNRLLKENLHEDVLKTGN